VAAASDTDKAELVNLLAFFSTKLVGKDGEKTDYKGDDLKDPAKTTELKTKLDQLSTLKGKPVYTSLDATNQSVINNLITELSEKITEMKNAQGGTPQEGGGNPHKTIITLAIIGGVALLLALVVYFMKKNSSEEGSEE